MCSRIVRHEGRKREEEQGIMRRGEEHTVFSCEDAPPLASLAFRSRFCWALAPFPILNVFWVVDFDVGSVVKSLE